MNACQGLYSVHDTAVNSRAYGATVFVCWPAAITGGRCLFLFQDCDSLGQVHVGKLKGTTSFQFHRKGFQHGL